MTHAPWSVGALFFIFTMGDAVGAPIYFDQKLNVKESASAVLKECSLDQKSQFNDALSSLRSDDKPEPGTKCLTSTESTLESTRDLLSELRKIREKEIYVVEALNELQYDDAYSFSDPSIKSKLKNMLCERSNVALTQLEKNQVKQSLNLKFNDCYKPESEISKMLSAAVDDALVQFKNSGMRKPTHEDLVLVNNKIKEIEAACIQIGAKKQQEVIYTRVNLAGINPSDQLRVKLVPQKDMLPKKASAPVPQQNPSDEKILNQKYQQSVYPKIVQLFSSPYGRLLSNSTYLHQRIGLDMDADWKTSGFCKSLNSNVVLSKGDMNTGYLGSPKNKIIGMRATVRNNIADLLRTRIPSMKQDFFDQLNDSSSFQTKISQVQQQIAYELSYQAKNSDIKKLIQTHPLYAQLACNALKHETFWNSDTTKKYYQWSKNIMIYGGMGAGLIGGFFSFGTGWAFTASIAAGLASATVATGTAYKDTVDQQKMGVTNKILLSQTAMSKQVEGYIQKFQKQTAENNLNNGSVISSSKNPALLREQLLTQAKSEREKAQIRLAYDYVSTAALFGYAKGLKELGSFAKTNNLDTVEKITLAAARLEGRLVAPSDIAIIVSSCLVVDDCTTVIPMLGIKAVSIKVAPQLLKAYRSIKGNESKTMSDMFDEVLASLKQKSSGVGSRIKVAEIKKVTLTPQPSLKSYDKFWLFHEYNYRVDGLLQARVGNQGSAPTCWAYSGCTVMELNGLVPKGLAVDRNALDGAMMLNRMQNYILSGDYSTASQENLINKVTEFMNTGGSSSKLIELMSAYRLRLVPRSEISTIPSGMGDKENRKKLAQNLIDILKKGGSTGEVNQKVTEAIKQKYGEVTGDRRSSMMRYLSVNEYVMKHDLDGVKSNYRYSSGLTVQKPKTEFKGKNSFVNYEKYHAGRARSFEGKYVNQNGIEEVILRNLKEKKALGISMNTDQDVLIGISKKGYITQQADVASGYHGSHAMAIVGVKTNSSGNIEKLLIQNSWGPASGQYGYVEVDWNKFSKSDGFRIREIGLSP